MAIFEHVVKARRVASISVAQGNSEEQYQVTPSTSSRLEFFVSMPPGGLFPTHLAKPAPLPGAGEGTHCPCHAADASEFVEQACMP